MDQINVKGAEISEYKLGCSFNYREYTQIRGKVRMHNHKKGVKNG